MATDDKKKNTWGGYVEKALGAYDPASAPTCIGPDPREMREPLYSDAARMKERDRRRREEEMFRQMVQMIDQPLNFSNAGAAGVGPAQQRPPRYTPNEKIGMRLNTPENEKLGGFEYLNAVRAESGEYVVFILTSNSQPVVLTDDGNLFPSDGLISKIRLLQSK
jgi:hypothetical protein